MEHQGHPEAWVAVRWSTAFQCGPRASEPCALPSQEFSLRKHHQAPRCRWSLVRERSAVQEGGEGREGDQTPALAPLKPCRSAGESR